MSPTLKPLTALQLELGQVVMEDDSIKSNIRRFNEIATIYTSTSGVLEKSLTDKAVLDPVREAVHTLDALEVAGIAKHFLESLRDYMQVLALLDVPLVEAEPEGEAPVGPEADPSDSQ